MEFGLFFYFYFCSAFVLLAVLPAVSGSLTCFLNGFFITVTSSSIADFKSLPNEKDHGEVMTLQSFVS